MSRTSILLLFESFEYLIDKFNLKLFYAETNSVNGGSVNFIFVRKIQENLRNLNSKRSLIC